MAITFGSLFAGIGGFDLGFERAGMECKWQVEIDDYATRVLEKHWPHVRRHKDIRTFPPESHSEWGVDVICGGPPCQPISWGGRQGGADDERWLWGETLRAIRTLQPKIAVLENPPALLSFHREFGDILENLAQSGYSVEWDCIPAGAFGAHFLGDRLFIFASSSQTSCLRWEGCWQDQVGASQWGRHELERLVCLEVEHGVPTGSLGRISDGISSRTHRLRGLGNAVVPQVAHWIGMRIVEALDN